MSIPTDRECIEYLIDAGCKKRVIIHCCTVRAVADEIISKIDFADKDLVVAGALLHDIGRAKEHTIMHAYLGSKMVEEYGLCQELVDIVRKHTGAGLDQEDVEDLGLPPGDYMPKTIEEKIVAHADNLVSDNRVVDHNHSVSKLINKGAFRGADRVEMLHMELSDYYGKDLDIIPKRIGEYPKLKLVDEYDLD